MTARPGRVRQTLRLRAPPRVSASAFNSAPITNSPYASAIIRYSTNVTHPAA
jgi:hypothetical protein